MAIVDMQKPVGWAAVWSPVAQLACQLGGSDINAHPWTPIESSLTDVRAASVRGGHIQVRVGSIPRHNHGRDEIGLDRYRGNLCPTTDSTSDGGR